MIPFPKPISTIDFVKLHQDLSNIEMLLMGGLIEEIDAEEVKYIGNVNVIIEKMVAWIKRTQG